MLDLFIIIAILSIILSIIALSKKELTPKIIISLISLSIICVILLFVYAIYEEKRIYLHKVNSFKDSKALVCRFNDIKIIISQDNNYILKDEYFIKDKMAIDVYKCKVLLNK